MYDVTEKLNNLKNKPDVYILGIESSCDETACAIVKNGTQVLSSVISTQIAVHRQFGGVVPEVASRNHTMAVTRCIDGALKQAGMTLSEVDAVAVTYGAGLAGALLVGVTAAKALAYATDKPLIKVNHIEGHISANYVEFPWLKPPFLALVASGGHTLILDAEDYCSYKLMGGTTDDAIGEMFDKTARLLGLPYPGGPEVDRLAKQGEANINFYRAHKGVSGDLNLSYSGLKTAVVNYLHTASQRGEQVRKEDVCASVTKQAVDLLVDTVTEAAERSGRKTVVLAGGVAANSFLREKLKSEGEKHGYKVLFPPPVLCTDNAVMIASRAYFSVREGKDAAYLDLNADPSLRTGV